MNMVLCVTQWTCWSNWEEKCIFLIIYDEGSTNNRQIRTPVIFYLFFKKKKGLYKIS